MNEKILCRILTGPTASGKTALSVRLAKEMGWEILCMDSMQIYRRMNIGTAKPTREEMDGVAHHLMDICEPTESFSVSAWRDLAEKKILELSAQGKKVLLVGGTGLYMNALLHPVAMGNVAADPGLRAELHEIADRPGGKEQLHATLETLDSATAARLPVNDIRRVIRAIEVTRLTGIPFSRQPDRSEKSRFSWITISTRMERSVLYDRINTRVGQMIRSGLKQEVADLLREGVPEDAQSMAGLGYKEMIPCVRGFCDEETAADAIRLGSRHYAKRQETFLKREKTVQYFDPTAADAYEKMKTILLGESRNE